MSFTKPRPLTTDERAERDRKTRRDEERRADAIARQYQEQLRTQPIRRPVAETALDLEPADALAEALADGQSQLVVRLAELGAEYDAPRLGAEYGRFAAGWTRALATFHPTPALAPDERRALAHYLTQTVAATVNALADDTAQRHESARIAAAQSLSVWAKTRRNPTAAVPPMTKEAAELLFGPDEDPSGYFTPGEVTEQRDLVTGKTVRVRTIHLPIGGSADEGDGQ